MTTGTIRIGDIDMRVAASAATPLVYKNVFNTDILKEIQAKEPDVNAIVKLEFLMVKNAELENLNDISPLFKLSEKDCIIWLTQYDPLDVIKAAPAALEFFVGQTKATSVPKKRGV